MAVQSEQTEFAFFNVAANVPIDVDVKVYVETDIKVQYGTPRVDATYGSDYTVVIDPADDFTVKVTPTPALIAKIGVAPNAIIVQRILNYKSDFQEADSFVRRRIASEFDKTIMRFQQIAGALTRSLRFPPADVASATLPPAAARANKALVFDASGNAAVSVDNYNDAAAAAAASAAAATAAAGTAAGAATSAGNAAVAAVGAAQTASDAAAAAQAALGSKADKATNFSVSGLITGGGTLGADRTFTVTAASNAEAIAGTISNKAVIPSNLPSAVSSIPYDLGNNALYKARANKDRWLDSYRLADELNFDPSATGNAHTVLAALVARAVASNRGEIILPRGAINLPATCTILNKGGQPVRIVGQGPEETIFLNTTAGQRFLTLGDAAAGATRSNNVVLEGFGFIANVAMNSSGSGIYVRNFTDLTMKDIVGRSMLNFISLGVGAAQTNDVVYTGLQDCGCFAAGGAAMPLLRLGSGGILQIGGDAHRWNGQGLQPFITHDDQSWNWDGLYVYGQFFEQFAKYLNSSAKGIVNAEWTGGQVDRADIAFHAEPGIATGSNRNWNIHDLQILGFPSGGSIGLLAGKGSSTDSRAVENIKLKDCHLEGLASYAAWLPDGGGHVQDNIIANCGNGGGGGATALIRVGVPLSQGVAMVKGNFGFRHSGANYAAYTYGIVWDGAAQARRVGLDNQFLDFATAATSGTV